MGPWKRSRCSANCDREVYRKVLRRELHDCTGECGPQRITVSAGPVHSPVGIMISDTLPYRDVPSGSRVASLR